MLKLNLLYYSTSWIYESFKAGVDRTKKCNKSQGNIFFVAFYSTFMKHLHFLKVNNRVSKYPNPGKYRVNRFYCILQVTSRVNS